MTDAIRVSLLVPAKDEAENLPEFIRQCAAALPALGVGFEVVVTDDGSRDNTPAVLAELQREHSFLRVATHMRQRGIADGLRSAADLARGDIFVFYPADLQYLPDDIPRLVAPILADEADIVTGTKQGKYEKAFVSTVYNTLCRWLFGIRVTDLNSVKAFRREVLEIQPLRPDFHRYMVVIAAAEGFRLTSTPVPLYPRTAGVSKFTWRRIPIGVLDLLSVWFQLRFGRKPMLFFGTVGALLFFVGTIAGLVAIFLRFGYLIGFESLRTGFRPLLTLVELMVVMGSVLIGFGFIGEMLAGVREDQREMMRRLHAIRRE